MSPPDAKGQKKPPKETCGHLSQDGYTLSSSPGHEGCLTPLGHWAPPLFVGALEEGEKFWMFPPEYEKIICFNGEKVSGIDIHDMTWLQLYGGTTL